MYVCVYVRRPAAGPTQPISPKFGVGSSFHPGSAPSQGATPNVDPRGVPPIVTPPEIHWRVNNWAGASKQKFGSPQPGALRVHPTKRGYMHWELREDQQTKVAPRGGFSWENYIYEGFTSPLGPQGPSTPKGVFAFKQFSWNLSGVAHFTWPQW